MTRSRITADKNHVPKHYGRDVRPWPLTPLGTTVNHPIITATSSSKKNQKTLIKKRLNISAKTDHTATRFLCDSCWATCFISSRYWRKHKHHTRPTFFRKSAGMPIGRPATAFMPSFHWSNASSPGSGSMENRTFESTSIYITTVIIIIILSVHKAMTRTDSRELACGYAGR